MLEMVDPQPAEYFPVTKTFKSQTEVTSCKRQRDIHDPNHCGSQVVFQCEANILYITLRHDEFHEVPVTHEHLSKAAITRIEELNANSMTTFQILGFTRTEMHKTVSYNTAQNSWNKANIHQFERNFDAVQYEILFSEGNAQIGKIYIQHQPFRLLITFLFRKKITSEYEIEEVLIDSTFKTNKPRLEMGENNCSEQSLSLFLTS